MPLTVWFFSSTAPCFKVAHHYQRRCYHCCAQLLLLLLLDYLKKILYFQIHTKLFLHITKCPHSKFFSLFPIVTLCFLLWLGVGAWYFITVFELLLRWHIERVINENNWSLIVRIAITCDQASLLFFAAGRNAWYNYLTIRLPPPNWNICQRECRRCHLTITGSRFVAGNYTRHEQREFTCSAV